MPTHSLAGLALLGLLVSCGGGPAPPPPPEGPPRLLVLSSTIGYIEPCGCTVDLLLGGIDRIASLVRAERLQGPTAVLLVGPHLFEKVPEPHMVGQEEAKARLIARSVAAIGFDAAVPTATELARGRPFHASLPGLGDAPDVTVNIPGGRGRILELGTLKVGVFGLVTQGTEVPGGIPGAPEAAARAEQTAS